MDLESSSEITALVQRVGSGDRAALDELVPLLYERLRHLAHRRLRQERSDHTLNTTALVHEAYLELVDISQAQWMDRVHFLAT
ncbi:MAG: ECF-type sigma factor, partial [Gemmatimonadales bacterium]